MKTPRRMYVRRIPSPLAKKTKIYKSTLMFETESKNEYRDITKFIQEEVELSRVKNGECIIRCPHTTCSIFLNEAEPALLKDFEETFTPLASIKELISRINNTIIKGLNDYFESVHFWRFSMQPFDYNFHCKHGCAFHHGCKKCGSTCDRNNAPAHIKTILENSTAMIQIEICNGKLDLGKYQSIIFWEHDGPRKRELKIKIISDE